MPALITIYRYIAISNYGTDLMQRRTREYERQRSRVRVQTLASTSNSNVPIASTYKAKLCRYMARYLYKQ